MVGLWHDLGGFCFLFDVLFLRGLGLRLFVVGCEGVVLWIKDLDVDLGIIGDLCLFEGLARVESAVFVQKLEPHTMLWQEIEFLTQPGLGAVVDVYSISVLMDCNGQLLGFKFLILEDEGNRKQVAIFL